MATTGRTADGRRPRREIEHLVGPEATSAHRPGGGDEGMQIRSALLGPAAVVGRAQAPGPGGPFAAAHRTT
ncbi:MAG: hypothetical protein M3450_20350, partial [Actinomycetota bacterium]|nr:hypothetical protein [Actinomycetota bacterium]